MTDVGFIGLGIMGTPMAGNLLAAGHRLFLHTNRQVPPALVDQGGIACRSGAEVAAQAEIIITMVPDTPHVEAALFGPEGVAKGLSPGKIVIDMSSISPIETKRFAARRSSELGCDVSGRAGLERRGRRQGGLAHHHGRQARDCFRARPAVVRKDG